MSKAPWAVLLKEGHEQKRYRCSCILDTEETNEPSCKAVLVYANQHICLVGVCKEVCEEELREGVRTVHASLHELALPNMLSPEKNEIHLTFSQKTNRLTLERRSSLKHNVCTSV